ncbi:MAG: hypothetical protein HND44_21880 [Chloroflexi bacterium]|nr:hypothetical protein [Ardenticatenaceae bacterium]MBL1131094.1 hypothetical protein [Chloroflexota bacterium]NOG37192.1 hypothetical protein [Chloroflexota bacterium]GIK55272.1 MAG: hypothetical protein BroJett015_09350 [Chloroflexota bacterium]
MLQTCRGIIDQNGKVRILEPVELPVSRQVIITILDEAPAEDQINLALLSEAALARDWERPEEDEAWSHLAQLPSL